MDPKNSKNRKAIIIEVLFYLSIFAYLLIIKLVYSNNVSTDFVAFLLYSSIILLVCSLVGAPYNRGAGLLLSGLYTLYAVFETAYCRGFGRYLRADALSYLSDELSTKGNKMIDFFRFGDLFSFLILFILIGSFVVLYRLYQKNRPLAFMRITAAVFLVVALLSIVSMGRLKKEHTVIDLDSWYSKEAIFQRHDDSKLSVQELGLFGFSYRDLFANVKNNSYVPEGNRIRANEYTGYFAGKNLIIIEAESFMNLCIDESINPDLIFYKDSGLDIRGLVDTGYGTTDSAIEFMANTSLLPIDGGSTYKEANLQQSLGRVFSDLGYKTFAFSSRSGEHLDSKEAFENYGYTFYDAWDVGENYETNDDTIGDHVGFVLGEHEHFLCYWITRSGAAPYYDLHGYGIDPDIIADYQEKYPELEDQYISYLSRNRILTKEYVHFIDILDWTNKLSNTVILFYGDHLPFGLDFSKGSNFDRVVEINEEDNPEEFTLPMFFYSFEGNLKLALDQNCTAADILPTILNLWGLNSEGMQLYGNDILSRNSYSFDENGNYHSNRVSYNVYTRKLEYNGITQSEAEKEILEFLERKASVSNELRNREN